HRRREQKPHPRTRNKESAMIAQVSAADSTRKSWGGSLKAWLFGAPRPRRRHPPCRSRLCLEPLEDRLVLQAGMTIDPGPAAPATSATGAGPTASAANARIALWPTSVVATGPVGGLVFYLRVYATDQDFVLVGSGVA